jgi:kumamolisin
MAAMTLPGSFRPPLPDIETIAPVDASEPVSATLVLRRHAPLPPGARFTAAELATHCGADPADVDAVTSARRIRVAGSAGGLSTVFGTSLSRVRRADGVEHRYREGALSLPASLAGAVVAVLGLDDRPQARSHFRTAAPDAVTTSYTPPQLARSYAIPGSTDGSGQTIAIIELGGGYVQSDLDHYFRGLGLADTCRPDADRDQHQLGAERGRMDRPGTFRHGQRVRRRCRTGRHGHRCLGR